MAGDRRTERTGHEPAQAGRPHAPITGAILRQRCRFEPAEIDGLLRHPLLAPMLRDLVLITGEGVLGFVSSDSSNLIAPDGGLRPTDGSPLRIVALPVDLLDSGEWADLQHTLFANRRTQVFGQLFRELTRRQQTKSTTNPPRGATPDTRSRPAEPVAS
jgi:hypothetical protein